MQYFIENYHEYAEEYKKQHTTFAFNVIFFSYSHWKHSTLDPLIDDVRFRTLVPIVSCFFCFQKNRFGFCLKWLSYMDDSN